jgi:transcription elongation factor GreA
MAAPDPVLTAAGRDRLQAELDHLRQVRRPEILERLGTTREAGVWDSPDYLSAREELAFVEGRITTLEKLLAAAEVVQPPAVQRPERVAVGVTVTVRDEAGAEEPYTIVGPAEADPREGRISNESPVGRALVGRRGGDTVTVQTPGGPRRLTILEIH